MSASFSTALSDGTVSQVADALHVSARDIWLPLYAYASSRGKTTTPVTIPDSTPMVLRDQRNGELFFNRQDILMKLCVLDTMDGSGLILAPAEVPPAFEIFLRWDRPSGTKRVPAGTPLLHFVMTDAQALATGSVMAPAMTAMAGHRNERLESSVALNTGNTAPGTRKRRRKVPSGGGNSRHDSVDNSTLVGTLHSAQLEEDQLARAVADLDERLAAARSSASKMNGGGDSVGAAAAAQRRVDVTREYATGKILQYHRLPPLHLLPSTIVTATGLELPAGVHWQRPDPRVLCRVWRRKNSSTAGYGSANAAAAAGRFTDASRQVVLFFVDDLVIDPVTATAAATLASSVSSAEAPTAPPAADGESATHGALRARRRRAVAKAMSDYAERGYRIVLIDHLPTLHHGSLLAAQASLKPLARFVEEEGTRRAPTVTVILSVVSRITAAQQRGISASFLMPNTGLLHFFVTELNASIELDEAASVVVGTRHRGSPFLDEMHAAFAKSANLRFVEVDALAEGTPAL